MGVFPDLRWQKKWFVWAALAALDDKLASDKGRVWFAGKCSREDSMALRTEAPGHGFYWFGQLKMKTDTEMDLLFMHIAYLPIDKLNVIP